MTPADARALLPGDRIRLRWQPSWEANPPERTVFTVLRVEGRAGHADVRIVTAEGFGYLPWEIDHAGEGARER